MTPRKNAVQPRTRMTAEARREVIERAATALFAERGYLGTSIDDIARGSGISVPVLYDHFASKEELHRHLLELHFADLRAVWRRQLRGNDPPAERFARAVDAWFAYVEAHPYAWRMLFRDDSGNPRVEAMRRDVAARSRRLLMPLFAIQPGIKRTRGDDESLAMLWEAVRSLMQGLALWWYDHKDVDRERVVEVVMNTLWLGLERVEDGERWRA
jgi:AcrR family transcriptional regulator